MFYYQLFLFFLVAPILAVILTATLVSEDTSPSC